MAPLNFKVVLVHPEIPQNTGSIGRTCVALNIDLILIKPYGFSIDEKAVRRAGLDYWKFVRLKEYDSFDHFLGKEKPSISDLFFFSRFAKKNYFTAPFSNQCYLIFGSETKGLKASLSATFGDNFYFLPTFSDKIRSLNLANTVTAVAYEVVRRL